jgi:hypothetical protein
LTEGSRNWTRADQSWNPRIVLLASASPSQLNTLVHPSACVQRRHIALACDLLAPSRSTAPRRASAHYAAPRTTRSAGHARQAAQARAGRGGTWPSEAGDDRRGRTTRTRDVVAEARRCRKIPSKEKSRVRQRRQHFR